MREDYRFFVCPRCQAQVAICSHCDRGQLYCEQSCSQAARQESVRCAGQRYQASARGRRKHAARQARYRQRQQANSQKVTHQGTQGPELEPRIVAKTYSRSHGGRTRIAASLEWVECSFCGSRCRPFARRRWLHRRR